MLCVGLWQAELRIRRKMRPDPFHPGSAGAVMLGSAQLVVEDKPSGHSSAWKSTCFGSNFSHSSLLLIVAPKLLTRLNFLSSDRT